MIAAARRRARLREVVRSCEDAVPVALTQGSRMRSEKPATGVRLGLLLVPFVQRVAFAAALPDYVFDHVDGDTRTRAARVIAPSGAAGRCSYSFGIPHRGNQLLLLITRDARFVRVSAGVFDLRLPIARPLPPAWNDGGIRYVHDGYERLRIAGQPIDAAKIRSVGVDSGDTEFIVSDRYGLLAYRAVETPGRFELSALPAVSLLDCTP